MAELQETPRASAATASPGLLRFEVGRRSPAFGGRSFGRPGPYEWLGGRVYGCLDPDHPLNQNIALLSLAPRNSRGQVEYWADFTLLRPVEASFGNRRLFYDVVNRGEQKALTCFNDVPRTSNVRRESEPGNAFLMRQGYTVAWSGWQGDIAESEDLLCAGFPTVELPKDTPALTRDEFIFDNLLSPVTVSLSYPACSTDCSQATLTVRPNIRVARSELPVESWRFLSPREIEIDRPPGFDAGAIFEFIYRARSPRVMGIGFAAIRDVVSALRYGGAQWIGMGRDVNHSLCANGIEHAIAFGTSQSGRLLRDLLWQGFNEDLAGRRVFDGVFVDGAGSRKSFVNGVFAQPGRFSRQHEDHSFPGDGFPFTYGLQKDEFDGQADGILRTCYERNVCPKVIHTDSSSEYWQGRAALVTSRPDGSAIELPGSVRVYSYSSLQHGGTAARSVPFCRYPLNPIGDGPLHRALLVALGDWISRDIAPPESRYPRVADGTLVPPHPQSAQGFPIIPGVAYPCHANDLEPSGPARLRSTYSALVPKVDADGNEIAGIRLPSITVPWGTYTGWNLRREGYAAGELASVRGSFFPFAPTNTSRSSTGDPRASLEQRYPNLGNYIRQVTSAARHLCTQRLLLEEDALAFTAEAGKIQLPVPAQSCRVPILSRDDLEESDREIFDDYQHVRNAQPSVIHRAIANAPSALRAYMIVSNELRYGTGLDARLRELAIVMVGYVTGSAYEVQAHTRFALQAGVRIEQIHELTNFETSVVYDDRERAVLRYAAQVTRRNCISTEVTVQLHRLFDRKTRLELALQVGFYNMVIRILGAFGIEPVSTL